MTANRLDEVYVVYSSIRGCSAVCFDDYEEAKEVCDQNNAALRRQNPRLTRDPAHVYSIEEYVDLYHDEACSNCDRD